MTEQLSEGIYASTREEFFAAIRKIQYVIKCVIHCYTGMRNAEALRLPYDCLSTKPVIEATIDDQGIERESDHMISLISTTTKLEGYKKEASWLAPQVVKNAISLGQNLAKGLASIHGVPYREAPLFINPSYRKNAKVSSRHFAKYSNNTLFDMRITQDDLALLRASDSSRSFTQSKFEVGRTWPLTTHQFRRSLAFYATSSGLVSLPSIKKQFKHHSLEMARYYSNGFENIKSIFGYYDSEKGEFVLPSSHTAFEYQVAVPMGIADQVMSDVLGENELTFGSTGSQAEKLRKRVQSGEISIEDIRKETEQRAKDGEISYRETLLGGCTYLGECNSFMLGSFSECLGCSGAVIKLPKLEDAVQSLEHELSCYDEESGEYEVTQYEISIFKKYRDAIAARVKRKELRRE